MTEQGRAGSPRKWGGGEDALLRMCVWSGLAAGGGASLVGGGAFVNRQTLMKGVLGLSEAGVGVSARRAKVRALRDDVESIDW